MRDYFHVPLWEKLGVKIGSTLLLVNAPENFELELAGMPEDSTMVFDENDRYDVAVIFVKTLAELNELFPPIASRIPEKGRVWVAWYKLSANIPTDVKFEAVQPLGLDAGLVDNKICAINAQWTGLQFMHRKKEKKRR